MALKWRLSIKDKRDKLDTPDEFENVNLELFFWEGETLNDITWYQNPTVTIFHNI